MSEPTSATHELRPRAATWTHVALRVRDIDASIHWYEEHTPLRLLPFPDCKRDLVVKDTLELMALQWSMDSLATDLLPPTSCLFITHDEVLVVDACKAKRQFATVYG